MALRVLRSTPSSGFPPSGTELIKVSSGVNIVMYLESKVGWGT
jgi:hypothetical protein